MRSEKPLSPTDRSLNVMNTKEISNIFVNKTINDQKNSLRRTYLNKRREFAITAEAKQADERICSNLLESEFYGSCDVLLAYYPLTGRGEVNITPILSAAIRDKKLLALPICRKNNNGEPFMEFHIVNSLEELTVGSFSIPEPRADSCVFDPSDKTSSKLRTIVVVPGVVFDREGYRIGYGGGYYDRFLARTANADIQSVGLVRSDFILPSLPHDSFDLPSDAIIDEKGGFLCRHKSSFHSFSTR